MDKSTAEFLRELNTVSREVRSAAENFKEFLRAKTPTHETASNEPNTSRRSQPAAEAPHAPRPETVRRSPSTDVGFPNFPPINLAEDAEAYYMDAAVPGADPARLDVSVEGDRVSLAGRQAVAREGGERQEVRREFPGGVFLRTVTLPGKVNAEGVSAEYKAGILALRLPKAQAGKRVAVTVVENSMG